jgi:hypothetical protein
MQVPLATRIRRPQLDNISATLEFTGHTGDYRSSLVATPRFTYRRTPTPFGATIVWLDQKRVSRRLADHLVDQTGAV